MDLLGQGPERGEQHERKAGARARRGAQTQLPESRRDRRCSRRSCPRTHFQPRLLEQAASRPGRPAMAPNRPAVYRGGGGGESAIPARPPGGVSDKTVIVRNNSRRRIRSPAGAMDSRLREPVLLTSVVCAWASCGQDCPQRRKGERRDPALRCPRDGATRFLHMIFRFRMPSLAPDRLITSRLLPFSGPNSPPGAAPRRRDRLQERDSRQGSRPSIHSPAAPRGPGTGRSLDRDGFLTVEA